MYQIAATKVVRIQLQPTVPRIGRSSGHNLCSDVTRPPTRKMRPFLLDRAAELKRRFQSHTKSTVRHFFTELGGWEVFSKCTRTIAFVPKWQRIQKIARVLKMTLPPSKALKLVILTPLRSVPHENMFRDCCNISPHHVARGTFVLAVAVGFVATPVATVFLRRRALTQGAADFLQVLSTARSGTTGPSS